MSFKTVQPGDPPWLKDAFAHLGLAEIPGREHNAAILAMFAEVGFPEVDADETSWCAAFGNWVAQRAGLPTTGKLTARSFLAWGSDAAGRPRRGDYVVIARGSQSWQGHVFLWLAEEGGYVWGIGGNQGKVGAVSVARFARSKVLGIRRPPAAVAPVPKARPEFPDYPQPLVRAVQQALRDRGYVAVGRVDGDYGPDTRGAILAFEADHGRLLTGVPTGTLLEAILSVAPKTVAPERSAAPAEAVRAELPEVKAAWQAKLLALWGAILSGCSWLLAFVGENFDGARQLVQPALNLFGDVPAWAYAGLIAGGLLVLWWRSRAAEQRQLAAYRSGARR